MKKMIVSQAEKKEDKKSSGGSFAKVGCGRRGGGPFRKGGEM